MALRRRVNAAGANAGTDQPLTEAAQQKSAAQVTVHSSSAQVCAAANASRAQAANGRTLLTIVVTAVAIVAMLYCGITYAVQYRHRRAGLGSPWMYTIDKHIYAANLPWPPDVGSALSLGEPLIWDYGLPASLQNFSILDRWQQSASAAVEDRFTVLAHDQPSFFTVNTSALACQPHWRPMFLDQMLCSSPFLPLEVSAVELVSYLQQPSTHFEWRPMMDPESAAAALAAQPLPSLPPNPKWKAGYLHLLLRPDQLLRPQELAALHDNGLLLTYLNDSSRASLGLDFSRIMAEAAQAMVQTPDKVPSISGAAADPAIAPEHWPTEVKTTQAYVGYPGVSWTLPWSHRHRFVTVVEGRVRAVLFPGAEMNRMPSLPFFHPRAGQPLLPLRTTWEQRHRRFKQLPAATVGEMTAGQVLYIPPGWTPNLVPLNTTVALVSDSPSAAEEVQRRAMAAVPLPLLNASMPAAARHRLLAMYVQQTAAAMAEGCFSPTGNLLLQRHRRCYSHLPVALLQAPDSVLAEAPPLQCAQPASLNQQADAQAVVRRYVNYVRSLYDKLPGRTRPQLVMEYFEHLVEHVGGGLHNLFVFFGSCV